MPLKAKKMDPGIYHYKASYDLMIFVLYQKRCTKIAKANVEEVQGEIIFILGLYDEVSKI